ncbi:MAG: dTDP-4-dehydrorhamnose reductase [Eubacteriales bacterium]
MKILVTGANGQLGHDVVKELKAQNIETLGCTRDDFDISNAMQVMDFIIKYEPNAIIHCAAYTSVDMAEVEPEKCYQINVVGTRNIAQACNRIGAKLFYISTDYIFDGSGSSEFEVSSKANPLSVYGTSKLMGENEIINTLSKFFILRTSWVFGKNGNNFIKTMLRLSLIESKLYVVRDQIGAPTYTVDLAKLIASMIKTEKYGIYQATNEGYCSWVEFAKEIMNLTKRKTEIVPIISEEYKTKAIRPKNSRLSKESLDIGGFGRLPGWKDALKRYLVEIGEIRTLE